MRYVNWNRRSILMLFAMGLNGFFAYAYIQFTTPAISSIVAERGFTDTVLINMISTLPGLLIIPSSLVCGYLTRKVNMKVLFCIGATIVGIFGFLTGQCQTLGGILFMRGMVGIGTGFTMLFVTAFAPYHFEVKALPFVLAVIDMIASLWGTVDPLLTASVIQAQGWRSCFALYLLAFLPALMTVLFIPTRPTVGVLANSESKTVQTHSGARDVLNPPTVGLAIAAMAGWFFSMVAWSNVSVYVSAQGLGTVGQAARAVSLITLTAFLSDFLVETIFTHLRHFTLVMTFSFISAASLCFHLAHGMTLIYLGCVFLGLWIGIVGTTIWSLLSTYQTQENQALAQSVVLPFFFFGQFLSTFWSKVLFAILKTSDLRTVYLANTVIVACIALGLLIFFTVRRNRAAAAQSEEESA